MPRRNRNAGKRHRRQPMMPARLIVGDVLPPVVRCKAQGGKVRFASAAAARDAIDRSRRRRNQQGPPAERTYRCPDCGGWHLTSRKTWRD